MRPRTPNSVNLLTVNLHAAERQGLCLTRSVIMDLFSSRFPMRRLCMSSAGRPSAATEGFHFVQGHFGAHRKMEMTPFTKSPFLSLCYELL